MPPPHGAVRAVLPEVSRETLDRLDRFAAVFAAWSQRINLVAASTSEDLWTRHIADSVQLLRLQPDARRWIDLGSGGGFPGMIIAILLAERDEARVDLIESNRRKAAFLQAARTACGAPALIHPARIETVLETLPEADVITARALAGLPDLLELSRDRLSASTIGLFHKGRGYADEVEESRDLWTFDLVKYPSLVAPDGAILQIGNLRRRR